MKKYFLLLPAVLFLVHCGGREAPPRESASAQTPARVARVERAPAVLEVAGTVRASTVAQLASRFGGFVRQVRTRAGARVASGELLVLIDDSGLQAQAEKATAAEQEVEQSLEEAKQRLQAAEAEKKLASNTFERIKILYDKGSASKQEYEEALSRRDASEAGWQAAQDRVLQMQSKLKQVGSDRLDVSSSLRYQRIAAPFDGIVTSVPAEEGSFVSPGQVVVSMENPGKYQLLFSVEQDLIPQLSSGKKIPVRIPVLGDSSVEAVVEEVSPSADAATRTYLVKANLPAKSSLRTGLSGRALLTLSRSSLWVPQEFLARTNDIETLMVKSGGGGWRRVLVKSGDRSGSKIEILSGLGEGDEIGLFEDAQ